MKTLTRIHREQHGVSLIELLVVMLLATIIGGYVTSSLVQGMRTAAHAQDRVYALAELERITQRISRELRAADPLVAASATEVEATVYRGGQRLKYRYQLSGDVLTQTLTTYATPIASTPLSTTTTTMVDDLDQTGVTAFDYRKDGDQPWVAGTDPISDIRQVRIAFARSVGTAADPILVQTAVELRNTGFGG